MPSVPYISTTYDGPSSATALRGTRPNIPLLALAPPALALGDEILGAGDEETNVRDFWNVISKASDIVKDGERLENLAWRQWCRHRRDSAASSTSTSSHFTHHRRISCSSSTTTGSSASAVTPHLEQPPSPTLSVSSRHSERRTFGSALKLLMEEDQFIDWVSDAQRNLPPPPTISVPDTPTAQLEIRLVEPTPVPSRVGSLGGSMSGAGMLGVAVPPRLMEEPEEQEVVEEEDEYEETDSGDDAVPIPQNPPPQRSRSKPILPATGSPKKKRKFFVHSSPSKGSGSDTAASPNTLAGKSATLPDAPQPPSPNPSLSPAPPASIAPHRRTSSGSSASAGPDLAPVAAPVKKKSPGKRHVSLSTMRGRFGVEKRKAAELLAQKLEAEAEAAAAEEEGSGWEDDEEEVDDDEGDWEEDEEAEETKVTEEPISIDKGKGKAVEPELPPEEGASTTEGSDEEWSDEGSGAEEAPPSRPAQAPSPTKKPPQPPPAATAMRRTSSSKSAKNLNTRNRSSSQLDLTALLARPSGRRGHASNGPPPPPAPTPLRDMSRKQRLAAQEERRKIEAELEAQKKREMFAKQHIFGAKPAQSEGLLSGIFKKGGSMVDLTAAGIPQMSSPPLRPSPTHGHLPSLLSLSRSPMAPAPNLLRSKSAVAMPVQTGVSVTRVSPNRSRLSEVTGSADSGENEANSADSKQAPERARRTSDRSDKSGTTERRPPEGIVLESGSESEEDDDYLATSSTQRKLAELAEKQSKRGKGRSPEAETNLSAGPSMAVPAAMSGAGRFAQPALEPMTPTTRRRTIISREMSMSLRQNLMLEREKSSGSGQRRTSAVQHSRPPPITHMSHLPARNVSTADLAQYQMGVPLARHRSETALHREQANQQQSRPGSSASQHGQRGDQSPALVHPQPQRSHTSGSVITMPSKNRPSHHPLAGALPPMRSNTVQPQAPTPQPEPPRRQPNILGGFLRPLTRVPTSTGVVESSRGGTISRTQSSANLTTNDRETTMEVSPTNLEAPAMVRRSTVEGSPGAEWKTEVDRRRELARRTDSSYRMHGW